MANTEGMAMKYTVLKNVDIENLLGAKEQRQLKEFCKKIQCHNSARKDLEALENRDFETYLHPKENIYLVINSDEPYADEVIEILKRNGHWG